MSDNTIDFNENTFKDEVLDSSKAVLVDFWAEWCGPCKMLTPTINELANEYQDKAIIGKVNVDNNPNLADLFALCPAAIFSSKPRTVYKPESLGQTSCSRLPGTG